MINFCVSRRNTADIVMSSINSGFVPCSMSFVSPLHRFQCVVCSFYPVVLIFRTNILCRAQQEHSSFPDIKHNFRYHAIRARCRLLIPCFTSSVYFAPIILLCLFSVTIFCIACRNARVFVISSIISGITACPLFIYRCL